MPHSLAMSCAAWNCVYRFCGPPTASIHAWLNGKPGPVPFAPSGHARHRLDPARDRDVVVAGLDAGRGEVRGLLGRPALPVDRRRGHVERKAGGDPRVAGDVHTLLAGLGHAAADDVVDLERVDPGAIDQPAQDQAEQVDRDGSRRACRSSCRSGLRAAPTMYASPPSRRRLPVGRDLGAPARLAHLPPQGARPAPVDLQRVVVELAGRGSRRTRARRPPGSRTRPGRRRGRPSGSRSSGSPHPPPPAKWYSMRPGGSSGSYSAVCSMIALLRRARAQGQLVRRAVLAAGHPARRVLHAQDERVDGLGEGRLLHVERPALAPPLARPAGVGLQVVRALAVREDRLVDLGGGHDQVAEARRWCTPTRRSRSPRSRSSRSRRPSGR